MMRSKAELMAEELTLRRVPSRTLRHLLHRRRRLPGHELGQRAVALQIGPVGRQASRP